MLSIPSAQRASSSVPSSAFERPQTLREFRTISTGISAQISLIRRRSMLHTGGFFSSVCDRRVFKWPLLSKVKYFRPTLSLDGLFRQRSSGYWRTRVSPPGITVTSTFRRRRRLFTWSVRWPRKKSHTRRNFPFGGLHGKHRQIHLPCPSVLSSGTKPS